MIGLLAAASLVAQPAPLHSGLWSSVRYSRESGDADGLEIIVPSTNAATVDLTVCEGGCTPRTTLAIKRDRIGFSFDYPQGATDQDGRGITLPTRHGQARFDGEVLVVQWLREDSVDILRHRARPLTVPRETPVLEKHAARS